MDQRRRHPTETALALAAIPSTWSHHPMPCTSGQLCERQVTTQYTQALKRLHLASALLGSYPSICSCINFSCFANTSWHMDALMTVDDGTKCIVDSGCTIWFGWGVYGISGSQGLLEGEPSLPFLLVNSFIFIFTLRTFSSCLT